MPDEKIGETIDVQTATHPLRTDSPEYLKSRQWLMRQAGGCYICGGPVDTAHPEASPAVAQAMQDHHGGGLFYKGALFGFNLFPLEWSMGWGASPSKVAAFVGQLNEVQRALGEQTYDADISDTAAVMCWVDSIYNANVKLCAPHHIGHPTQHTPDINGHEAVGIHNAPWPVLAAQATCDWARFDMWGGTTGTLAVAPHPDGSGKVVVTHVDDAHPGNLAIGQELAASHPSARAAHAGDGTT